MDLLTANDRVGEYPASYYTATSAPPLDAPALQGTETADVCVIGGGYTGLSAALHLAERGYSVILLEAHRVGWGASGRNGGQVGSGQRLDQGALERMVGATHARGLWDMAEEAKDLVQARIATHKIACDLKPGVMHALLRDSEARAAEREVAHLRDEYGYAPLQYVPGSEMAEMLGTDIYRGGALDMGAAHLHPLNYALGLARAAVAAGVQVFERSRVTSVSDEAPHLVRTDQGEVRAKFVIYAANGYLGELERRVAARAMPINNFILATEPLGKDAARALIRDDVAVADSKFVVNYYRLSADHRLIFGGGESYGYRFPRDITALVRRNMLRVYPGLAATRIDYAWGGTLAITRNRMPHFAALSPTRLSAAGYSGHGVAMASLAGKLLAERVAGQAERFDLFANIKSRPFWGGISLRTPLLVLAMSWYALRDRI